VPAQAAIHADADHHRAACRHIAFDSYPEGPCLAERCAGRESDRGITPDCVQQHVGERVDVRLVQRPDEPLDSQSSQSVMNLGLR
jgi:hypothetical protein